MSEAIRHKNVTAGPGLRLDPFVELGVPPGGKADGSATLVLGADAWLRSHTVVYAGNKIGDRFRTGHHVLIRENNIIGHDVQVGSFSQVAFECVLEDGVRVHSGAHVFEKSMLRKGCWIGPGVLLTNARYPVSKRSKEFIFGCEVGEKARLGAGSILLPGVKVGRGALVGAGAVVTKDLPAFAVAVGNPAKVTGDVRELRYPDGELAYPEEVA